MIVFLGRRLVFLFVEEEVERGEIGLESRVGSIWIRLRLGFNLVWVFEVRVIYRESYFIIACVFMRLLVVFFLSFLL